jgi:hypothetical protein
MAHVQVQSELKQQMKGNAQAPKMGLKKPPLADEPPEGPRPSALPPSPRMHPSATPPVSPRIRNIPTTASLLESSTHSSRAAAVPPDQDAAASSTPFFVSPPSPSPSPATPPTLRGFSSLPPQQVTPRPEQLVPSPQSVPATGPQLGCGGSLAGSVRVRRGPRPSPLLLTSFNIDNEAQLAEAESKYYRDPAKFTSVYAANPLTPSAETATLMTSAMPPASTECAASMPVMDLPPPPASMVLPAIPQQPGPTAASSGRQQHHVSSGESWGGYDSSESDQSIGEDEGEGEDDELVAMLVQSTLKESQARGITIRDCSAQMMNNLDDALAMLAKLEFEL